MSIKISDASIPVITPTGTEHVPLNNSGSKAKALLSGVLNYIRNAAAAFTVASVNKVAITAPATGATLTIADGKTLQVTDSIVLSGNGKTLQITDDLILRGAADITFAGTGTAALVEANISWTSGHDFAQSISVTGDIIGVSSVKSFSPTAGMGYGTGAGGAVTQLSSKSTGVTLNKVTGAITLDNAALADNATVTFVVTCSACAANDVVSAIHKSAGTAGAYLVWAHSPTAGTFSISVRNVSGGSLSQAIVLQYAIIKGAVS